MHEPPGYRLAVAGSVDVLRVERLADEAARSSDPFRRRTLLDQALDLWRAEEPSALSAHGLADDAGRLARRRLVVTTERGRAALATGDPTTAEVDARAVLQRDSLHEPAAILLVETLAATGRTAEADAVVQAFRNDLGEQIGLDPSPAFEDVHRALLHGRLPLAGSGSRHRAHALGDSIGRTATSPRAREAPLVPRRDSPGHPPLPRSTFRGRDEALASLAAAVASERCVTLVGPGGVGKTRLALELAHRHGGMVVWADLLDARTVDDVLGRLALAAGSATPTSTNHLAPLTDALDQRPTLIVLDNCEQAIQQVAEVVDGLLHATRRTTVLATTRTPLAIDGEHIAPLVPLATSSPDEGVPAALQLFADRMGPDIGLDDPDRRRIASDVVVALDGLPLAIELAARQARNLGLVTVRDRLGDRLELLGTTRSVDHPAHSDLRSLVRWSTDELDEPDQRAFRWLSAFAGPFTLTQAEALLGPDGADIAAVPAAVGRLVEQSLVARRPPDRFVLLETLRACGTEQLEDAEETDVALARHTDIVIAAAEAANADLRTTDELAAVAAIDALVADLQAVTDRLVAQHDAERLGRLACALNKYAYETQRPELLRCAVVALALVSNDAAIVSSDLRDGIAVAAAVEASTRGDLGLAQRRIEPVITNARSSEVRAEAWEVLGDLRLWRVDPDAEQAYRTAAGLYDEVGNDAGVSTAWVGITLARAYAGDAAAARRAAEVPERHARRVDSPLASAWAAYARGEAEASHDPEAALAAFDRAMERGRLVGGHLVMAAASGGAAAVRARHGDPEPVLHHIRDALRELDGSGNSHMQLNMLRNLAVLLTRMGSDEAAAVLLGATETDLLYEAERRRVDTAVAAVTERLGDQRADRKRAEGAAMEPAEAVAVALDTIDRLDGA